MALGGVVELLAHDIGLYLRGAALDLAKRGPIVRYRTAPRHEVGPAAAIPIARQLESNLPVRSFDWSSRIDSRLIDCVVRRNLEQLDRACEFAIDLCAPRDGDLIRFDVNVVDRPWERIIQVVANRLVGEFFVTAPLHGVLGPRFLLRRPLRPESE